MHTKPQSSRSSVYTHLREVAYQMAALHIVLGQHIEKKWLHIVIERLVVQEEFCQEAQVLAVNGTDISIHLRGLENIRNHDP